MLFFFLRCLWVKEKLLPTFQGALPPTPIHTPPSRPAPSLDRRVWPWVVASALAQLALPRIQTKVGKEGGSVTRGQEETWELINHGP